MAGARKTFGIAINEFQKMCEVVLQSRLRLMTVAVSSSFAAWIMTPNFFQNLSSENTGLSKSLFDDRMSLSLSLDNIFDQGGFQMNRYQPVSASSDILQYTNVNSKRGGRTLALNIKYNFGKMQEEKRKGRGRGFGGGGNEMDMGY